MREEARPPRLSPESVVLSHVPPQLLLCLSLPDSGAQSDSELPSYHQNDVSLDRGYTSDSEVYTDHGRPGKIHRSATDADMVNSGWLVVSLPPSWTYKKMFLVLREDVWLKLGPQLISCVCYRWGRMTLTTPNQEQRSTGQALHPWSISTALQWAWTWDHMTRSPCLSVWSHCPSLFGMLLTSPLTTLNSVSRLSASL